MARPTRHGIGARPLRVTLAGAALPATCQLLPHRANEVRAAFARGNVLDDSGNVLSPADPVRSGQLLWAFDDVPDEPETPIHLDVVAESERWIIVDKPHGLASMPRGTHVARTVTVAARRQFDNDGVVAAHRLDALTAGLLLLTKAPQWRRSYQQLFERREVGKVYYAVVDTTGEEWRGNLACHAEKTAKQERASHSAPHREIRVELHLHKPRGSLQTAVLPSDTHTPNSVTDIEVLGVGPEYGWLRLRPLTGKTHQLRATCAHLGMPIIGDPLYPEIQPDLSLGVRGNGAVPLQLLATSIKFIDPVNGQQVTARSGQTLALWGSH